MTITAAQCRAARGLLAWSQGDLAGAAKVSRNTVAGFENDTKAPHHHNLAAIRAALESAGVEFTNGNAPGVRIAAHEANE